jgi:hypothetical protein
MRLDIHALTGLLAIAAPAVLAPTGPGGGPPAAVPDSGAFIIRHADDTVAVERFTRTPTSLNGTLQIHDPRHTSQSYQATVAEDGSVPVIEVQVREDVDSGRVRGKVVQRARVIFKEDSAAVDDVSEHGMQTRVFGTERGAVPYLNLSFALLEQAVLRSRASAAAGARVPLFNLGGARTGGGQTVEAMLTPLPGDSVVLTIGKVDFHLRIDGTGRVLGGRIPGQGVVAERK